MGAVTGTLYRDIQQNATDCNLTTQDDEYIPSIYPHIILYDDVLGDHQCYFVMGTDNVFVGVLGSNAEIGQTVNLYRIENGSVSQTTTEYLQSSTPSDYFENIRTRNFTLTQR